MKYLIIFLIIQSLAFINVFPQSFPGDVDPDKSADNSEELQGAGTFIGLDYKISKINNVQADQLGLSVGALLNRQIGIGVSYFSLLGNSNKVTIDSSRTSAISLEYGGFCLDYSFFPTDWIRLGAGGVFSVGRMSLSSEISGIRNYYSSDWFGMAEPRVFAGIHIFSNFWIVMTYWYMAPFGLDYYNINSSSLSGSAFGIGIYTF